MAYQPTYVHMRTSVCVTATIAYNHHTHPIRQPTPPQPTRAPTPLSSVHKQKLQSVFPHMPDRTVQVEALPPPTPSSPPPTHTLYFLSSPPETISPFLWLQSTVRMIPSCAFHWQPQIAQQWTHTGTYSACQ